MSREVTEEERIAYRRGYMACCLNHGLPYVGIEPDKWTDQAAIQIRVSNLWFEQLIKSGSIESYGVDIAKRLVAEYQEYKKSTTGREPKKEVEQTCERCGCVFAYGKEDVKIDHQYNESFYSVKCPCCGKYITVKCFDEY